MRFGAADCPARFRSEFTALLSRFFADVRTNPAF
jgi:hypothetical protein